MGMSEFYGPLDDAESIATIHRALELGATLLDTADMYGPYKNEELVGRAIKGKRDQLVIATNARSSVTRTIPTKRGINGTAKYIRDSSEGSLKRLGIDVWVSINCIASGHPLRTPHLQITRHFRQAPSSPPPHPCATCTPLR
jgi:aryl-alcohol dehydrogenase-like predicted oxidoreductase